MSICFKRSFVRFPRMIRVFIRSFSHAQLKRLFVHLHENKRMNDPIVRGKTNERMNRSFVNERTNALSVCGKTNDKRYTNER